MLEGLLKTELGARIPQLHCAIGVCPYVRVHAMCTRTMRNAVGLSAEQHRRYCAYEEESAVSLIS